jgi:benzoylformate decarboxylase
MRDKEKTLTVYVATAKAFGCAGVAANTTEEIKAAFKTALTVDGPTVIAIRTAHQLRPLADV